MVHFWAKLKFGKQDKISSILCHFMTQLCISSSTINNFKWLKHIKENIDQSGFGWVWNTTNINLELFKSMFKQRSLDIFIQNWQADIDSNSQCSTYKVLKRVHEIEFYIGKIEPAHAYNLIHFRTRTHQLPVSRDRFNENADIKCNLCQSGHVGDEIHYLFHCKHFSDIRVNYLPANFKNYEKENSFQDLFQMDEKSLTKLARFVKIIMNHFKLKSTRLAPRKQIKTRAGRHIKPPDRLDL